MSRSDVVRRLRALASRGVPMSVRYLLPVHADLVGQSLAIFGSFDRARAVAGLAAPPLEHDPDVIIGALRSLARSGVRLDVTTLSTMGESTLVAACVDTFGSVAAAAARAGLGPPPPERRPTYSTGGGGHGHGGYAGGHGGQPGFAQPPITTDGNVSTALALEVLQKTALQLGRVPAARDLPPDVARRLTSDYGSVRFAYLALRVHAEGSGASRPAETAAEAAAAPVAEVTQEALAATARLLDGVGQHRKNVEAAAAHAPLAAPPVAPPAVPVSDDEFAAAWAEVEQEIERASTSAAIRLHAEIGAALDGFVGQVADLVRQATLAALAPGFGPPARAAAPTHDEDDDLDDDDELDDGLDDDEPDDDGSHEGVNGSGGLRAAAHHGDEGEDDVRSAASGDEEE